MSFSFNNPLIIGDINKQTKADITELQNDIGDLSQLDTGDKSSIVNAINDALDSTLNGASRDLNNLSDIGNDKLRSLNSYANEGELLTDADGLAFVKKYAHSTFDRSKFTVVGSPNITDDGIASGFSGSNYLTQDIDFSKPFKLDIKIKTPPSIPSSVKYFLLTSTRGIACQYSTTGVLGIKVATTAWGSDLINATLFAEVNTEYLIEIEWTGTQYICKVNGTQIDSNASTAQVLAGVLQIGGYPTQDTSSFNGSIDLKQFSITVDGVPVFSGNKTGIDTIKPDDYTVVGSPTISADGIYSNVSLNDYIDSKSLTLNNDFEIDLQCVVANSNANIQSYVTALYDSNNSVVLDVRRYDKTMYVHYKQTDSQMYAYVQQDNSLGLTKSYKLIKKGNHLTVYVDGQLVADTATNMIDTIGSYTLWIGRTRVGNLWDGSIDLNAFKIYVDGDLVYQPCLKIPYTESKTGSKIVDSIYRDRVADMSAQFGFANYYTLSDTDFTLPQVELYGLMGQKTLRYSYENGINKVELYSNRDLTQQGSCTSGVEVTFLRPFADTNYILTVPYSAKSATAFTPTQTGDWKAEGKGWL